MKQSKLKLAYDILCQVILGALAIYGWFILVEKYTEPVCDWIVGVYTKVSGFVKEKFSR